MKRSTLSTLIDWDTVMAQTRCARGHMEVMENIFGGNAVVIASYIEACDCGAEVFVYRFYDDSIVIIADYFGSCFACDSWEDANDDEARQMISALVHAARIFQDTEEAREYCANVGNQPEEYPFWVAENLQGKF